MGALGVVFGDIGTSPLYALRETFLHDTSLAPTPDHVLGVLSTLFWAVTLTVTIKYVTLIMRADNKGEGGVLALATLATHGLNGKRPPGSARAIITAGGDRAGAVLRRRHHHAGHLGDERGRRSVGRGARPSSPTSCRWSLVILVALFLLQARGTADVGRLFGPGHAGLVRRAGCPGRLADRQEPVGPAGDQSALCGPT